MQGVETPSAGLPEPDGDPLASCGVREPGGVHCDSSGWRSPASKESVHPVKEPGVDTHQCLLKEGVAGSPVESEPPEERGVEVDLGNEVTVAEARVELETEEDKENRERELDRPSTSGSDVRDCIAKDDKLVEQEVIAASLGRIM